jgi:hypothetical protein
LDRHETIAEPGRAAPAPRLPFLRYLRKFPHRRTINLSFVSTLTYFGMIFSHWLRWKLGYRRIRIPLRSVMLTQHVRLFERVLTDS